MSSRFITETELEEKRKVRQEEWERVRKPEDPTEAPLPPEEMPDRRSLYERLQEQKSKKQEEFEESRKLKNLVKGLDDDEAEYLEDVDKARVNEERRKRMEEARELSEFRSKVAEMREKDIDTIIKQEIGLIKTDKKPTVAATETLPSIGVSKTSQSQRLAGLVKRKSSGGSNDPGPSNVSSDAVETETKRVKIDSETPKVLNATAAAPAKGTKESSISGSASSLGISDSGSIDEIPSVPYKGSLVCIGVLPGLASYDESSDSCEDDSSSDSDNRSPAQPLRDLVGRTIGHQEGKDSAKDKEKKS